MIEIKALNIIPKEILSNNDFYLDEPLLEYVATIAAKYKPLTHEDVEAGYTVSRAISYFAVRYSELKFEHKIDKKALPKYLENKDIQQTIEAMGYDVEKFWYLLMFIYDYSYGFCWKGFNIKETPKKQITKLINGITENLGPLEEYFKDATFINPVKIVLEVKGKHKIVVDDPNAIFWLTLTCYEEIEKLESGHRMNISHTKLIVDNGKFIYDPLSTSVHIWYFAKMFLTFFDLKPPVKTIGKKNDQGQKISFNKYLLVTRLLYCVGLLSDKKKKKKNDNQDSEDVLKGFLKQYKNSKMERVNSIYM